MSKKASELLFGMASDSTKELGGKWVELNGFPSYEVSPDEGYGIKRQARY